jgi:hypothetical protein
LNQKPSLSESRQYFNVYVSRFWLALKDGLARQDFFKDNNECYNGGDFNYLKARQGSQSVREGVTILGISRVCISAVVVWATDGNNCAYLCNHR